MTSSELSAIELFAGAGGFAIGLQRAGFTPLILISSEDDAIATIQLNRPTWSVTRVSPHKTIALPKTDLLVADLPSDSVSEASLNHAEHSPMDRLIEVVRVAEETSARAIVVQGVRGLATAKHRAALAVFRDRLWHAGYVSDWRIVTASQFGVPQLRPRFVLIALKSRGFTRFDWPVGERRIPSLGETLLPLMEEDGWDGAQAWARSAVGLAPTIIGGSRRHGGADLGPTRTKRAWLVLGVDPRGVASQPPSTETPTTVLPRLTNRMIAAIQAFPEDWEFVGSRTSVYRQIAGSTPPPVAEAIGKAIAAALR